MASNGHALSQTTPAAEGAAQPKNLTPSPTAAAAPATGAACNGTLDSSPDAAEAEEAPEAPARQPAAEAPVAPAFKRARRMPSDAELKGLEAALGHSFADKWLLRQALVHPSFGEFNNSRLTWLGDAVLTAAVSDLLYQALPEATTAELHDRRCSAVRRDACAVRARQLGLHGMLVVGRAYNGAEPSVNMLAEAYEAVWGAVYADAGYSMQTLKTAYVALFSPAAAPAKAAAAGGAGSPAAGEDEL